ncbi:MAG TPA: ATP-binding protein [Dehalococcoidia bacterium]|nr:ATP-binding protein [Dehalococcoidia bacterium]
MASAVEKENRSGTLHLAEPGTVAETGLDYGFVLDLTMKTINNAGRPSARQICDLICLPFKLMEEVLEFLRRQEYLDIVGSIGVTEQDYQYMLTARGVSKLQTITEHSQYVGPAPVPFALYTDVIARQSVSQLQANPEAVANALDSLVLHPETIQQIGTAVGAGRSLFIYGPPGNGKSTIAECLVSLLSDDILIPYAFEVFGQVIRVHDPLVHHSSEHPQDTTESEDEAEISQRRDDRDRRWAICRRPLIVGGGEVTRADLELRYSEVGKFYVAPAQMKASNGVLIIDDFGRQLIRPEEMLNRWMIPMDRNIDHLAFQTGETVVVPFDVLLLFATNLKPSELGDEAFFRRIRHKVRISDPTREEFIEILRRVSASMGLAFSPGTANYLVKTYYEATGRPFRGVHPRDIFNLIEDMCRYTRQKPAFTRQWVDRACASYFLEE